MLLTFLVEVLLAIWVFLRYRWDRLSLTVLGLLLGLAAFQLSEFQICGGEGSGALWSRTGYLAITLLPPLGLKLVQLLGGKPSSWALKLAWASGAILAIGALALPVQPVCGGNYVIFMLPPVFNTMYSIWYFGVIAYSLAIMGRPLRTSNAKRRAGLSALTLAYVAFLLPTAIWVFITPQSHKGVPSIMCGFAVLFAVIVVTGVLPKVAKKRAA
jgi:hypothetical protein